MLRKPEVDEIIHAGDAGREGELIVRNIVNLCNVNKPMKTFMDFLINPKSDLLGIPKSEERRKNQAALL
ncbi:hypothetical protein QFZ73_004548 [Peribacillus sp. V2I11]|nr:hypothetical protein [Peribacillus sp. V2I11]